MVTNAGIAAARMEARREQKRRQLAERAKLAEEQLAEVERPWNVITGDSVAELAKLAKGSVDLVFADPPYNIGFDYGHGHDDSQSDAAYLAWCDRWLAGCVRALSPTGTLWALINDEYAAEYNLALKRFGLTVRNWVIWYETFGVNCTRKFNRTKRHLFYCVKDARRFTFHRDAVSRPSDRQAKYGDARANPEGKLLDDVWTDIPRLVGTAAERVPDFPTQLPLALLRRVIACCSNPGELVLDPFNGSGTTGAAAVQLGRRYVGFERNPDYAERARQRLLVAQVEGRLS